MMTCATVSRAIHVPVMVAEVTQALEPCLGEPGAVIVDGTVGLGGHAQAILEASPQARLVGIDQDGEAIEQAGQRLAQFGERVHLVRSRFDVLDQILDQLGIHSVQAILFDLGLSSLQIDDAHRGFAYAKDGPLDMRMDDRLTVGASDIVNTWAPADLAAIIRDYGEDPHALRVAQAIVMAREGEPIVSTSQLAGIVINAMPAAVRYGSGGHPAKRVFQALRIAVNGELDALEATLPVAMARLARGGRLAVLSYQSLDDRLVKRAFQLACQDGAPRRLPVVPEHLLARFALVTKGAARPSIDEVERNPRAASARLRVIEAKAGLS